MEDALTLIFTGLAIVFAYHVVRWRASPLYSIPTAGGSSAPLLSYLTALNLLLRGKEVIEEGYQKYHGSMFKIPLLDQWFVIVTGPKMIDELRRRPDDELSFQEGVEDVVQMRYTIGRDTIQNQWHTELIKEKLTRSLPAVLPEVIDELKLAVHEHIPAQGDEWVSVNPMKVMQEIVARASNRAFVGVPICRDRKYLDLSIRFTLDVMKDRYIMNAVPHFLKSLVGSIISSTKKTVKEITPLLQPALDERRAKAAELGDDWDDKPNDMLQWLIDEASNQKASDTGIIERILVINFAAIHTSSNSITHALYDLAAQPEYLQPLRDEVESIISVEGWTKAAMGKMWKLDSFLKECARCNGISLLSITRKAMVDLTFSDGTFIPKGTLLSAAAGPSHTDEANYENPHVFDPFRFSRMREVDGEGTKHQYVNTSIQYMPFGHGKHACPGRFFAANELKAMLAYMVLNYDMKMGGDGKRPPNSYFSVSVVPPLKSEILFRKRQVTA